MIRYPQCTDVFTISAFDPAICSIRLPVSMSDGTSNCTHIYMGQYRPIAKPRILNAVQ